MKTPIIVTAFLIAAARLFANEPILSDDTYVLAKTPAAILGKKPTLVVSARSKALLKFDLSPLQTNLLASQVGKATLKIYAATVTAPGTIGVVEQTSTWSEAVSPLPTVGPAISQRMLTSADKRKFITFDVTELVQQWVADPETNFGICLAAQDNSANVTFDSKESVASGQSAELVLSIQPATVVVRAVKPTVQTFAASTVTPGAIVTNWQTQLDSEGAFNASTGTFTAPIDGTYLVAASFRFATTSWNEYSQQEIYLIKTPLSPSGVESIGLATNHVDAPNSGPLGINGTTLIHLAAGDVINIGLLQDGPGSKAITSNQPYINHLSIARVAD